MSDLPLFENEEFEKWKEEWKDMPEYTQKDNMPFRTIYLHFRNNEDAKEFAKLIGQQITSETISLWYPKATIGGYLNKRWVDEDVNNEP